MALAQHILLAPAAGYRSDFSGPRERRAASHHLRGAADALALAVLSLGGSAEESVGEKRHRAENARSFLVEAVTALSRARIYVPGIHTHALPFVLASEQTLDAELGRLHQIATRLLWRNHAYLPARAQAKPLPPEEEAQLAVLLQGLARSARIERATRYKWVGAGFVALGLGYLIAAPLAGFVVGVATLAWALWSLARERRRDSRTRSG